MTHLENTYRNQNNLPSTPQSPQSTLHPQRNILFQSRDPALVNLNLKKGSSQAILDNQSDFQYRNSYEKPRQHLQLHNLTLLTPKESMQDGKESNIVYDNLKVLKKNSSYISKTNQLYQNSNSPNSKYYQDRQNARKISKYKVQSPKKNKTVQIFGKIKLLKSIKDKMVSYIYSRNYYKLTKNHFQIINDISHLYINIRGKSIFSSKYLQKNPLFGNFFKIFFKFFNRFYVILPNSPFFITWNIILLTFFLMQYLFIPLQIVFQTQNIEIINIFSKKIPSYIFFIKFIIQFNTAYYEKGFLVKNRPKIFKKYFYFHFQVDLLIFTFSIFLKNSPYSLLIYLLSVRQTLSLIENIEEQFQLQQNYYSAYELIKLILLIFYTAHYSACIFFLIGNNQNGFSWVKKYEIKDLSWQEQYLDSLYFAFITMATVGYGDIAPISISEKVYVIFFTFVSCGFFAYAVNTIGSIFQEVQKKQADYKLKKYEMINYMEVRNISRDLQVKILKNLEYINHQEKQVYLLSKGQNILSSLSESLQQEFNQEFFGKILAQCSLFRENFTEKLIQKLSLKMKEINLAPGEYIYQKGQVNDHNLYYVLKGNIEYILPMSIKQVKFGNFKGDFIGQIEFFTGGQRQYTVRCTSSAHIIYCSRDDMLKLIEQSELDQEQFSLIQNKILFDNYQCMQKCMFCKSLSHNETNCNLLSFNPNKELIILKHEYNVSQVRKKYKRKYKLGFQALTNRPIVRFFLLEYRIRLISEFREQKMPQFSDKMINLSDKNFFLKTPKVKLENGVVLQDSKESLYSDFDALVNSKEDLGTDEGITLNENNTKRPPQKYKTHLIESCINGEGLKQIFRSKTYDKQKSAQKQKKEQKKRQSSIQLQTHEKNKSVLSICLLENQNHKKDILEQKQELNMNMFYSKFENLKEFTVYYPKYNVSQVIKRIKQIWISNFNEQRKQKRKSKNTNKQKINN